MDALRQYILSIAAAAMLCGFVLSIAPKGRLHPILKMIGGVFLALMVLQPITNLNPEKLLSRFPGEWKVNGEAAAAVGEEIAADAMSAYIKDASEAYILDKACELGLDLDVEIFLTSGDLPVPEKVYIRGFATELKRRELESVIQNSLGIAKENLQWTG